MNVLIATDGTLDPERAATFASTLAGTEGTITVLTMVEINRNLLRDLRELFGERLVEPTHQDGEYVGLQRNGGSAIGADWPGDDAMVARYLEDQKVTRTHTLVAALGDLGIQPTTLVREGEAASGIAEAAKELEVDVVCVGTRGAGLFDGLLGSTSTKLARRAPTPVLIIR